VKTTSETTKDQKAKCLHFFIVTKPNNIKVVYVPRFPVAKILAHIANKDNGDGVVLNSHDSKLMEKEKLVNKGVLVRSSPNQYRLTEYGKFSITLYQEYRKALINADPKTCGHC